MNHLTSGEVVLGHRCEHTTSVGGTCFHTRLPTEAIVEITLETGGEPVVMAGGIAASGYYRVVPVEGDLEEAIQDLERRMKLVWLDGYLWEAVANEADPRRTAFLERWEGREVPPTGIQFEVIRERWEQPERGVPRRIIEEARILD